MAIIIPSNNIFSIQNDKIQNNIIKNVNWTTNTLIPKQLIIFNETVAVYKNNKKAIGKFEYVLDQYNYSNSDITIGQQYSSSTDNPKLKRLPIIIHIKTNEMLNTTIANSLSDNVHTLLKNRIAFELNVQEFGVETKTHGSGQPNTYEYYERERETTLFYLNPNNVQYNTFDEFTNVVKQQLSTNFLNNQYTYIGINKNYSRNSIDIYLDFIFTWNTETNQNEQYIKDFKLDIGFPSIVKSENNYSSLLGGKGYIHSKNDFDLPSNELSVELFSITPNPDVSITPQSTMADSIVRKYFNGQETAVINCAIADYYTDDKNKTLAISTSNPDLPMTFKIGDVVKPYTYTIYGEKPMSDNKEFVVVGSKIIADGAITQELTLIEK